MKFGIKQLASETIIYGFSTIIGRFINWLLIPTLYVRTNAIDENGALGQILAFMAILLVLFTFGLETGFFRFSREGKQNDVFKTSVLLLTITSSLLIIFTFLFVPSLNNILADGKYLHSLYLAGIIIAIDAFLSIPFANLRLKNKAVKFATIKLINIGLLIFFNFLFLLIIPAIISKYQLSNKFVLLYNSYDNIFYIFLSNLIATISMIFFFIKDLRNIKGNFDFQIAKSMFKYCLPILIVGLTGMINQNSDRLMMPTLTESGGLTKTGLYTINFKIGVLMSLFTQAFRYAFEPYFFKIREKGKEGYAKIMEYFIFAGMLIFLGVTLFMDIINIIITDKYSDGNIIIPFILIGFLFYGIYYNLSLWYKLTDKTIWAIYFGVTGMIISIALNIILVPRIGIIGAALALFFGYFVMVIFSYLRGQKVFYVPYNLKRIGLYFVIGFIIYFIDKQIFIDILLLKYLIKIFFLAIYFVVFMKIEKLLLFNK
ncbi:MAG: polysaccharide biosynthesis C-terminal domain-containing protein [Marinilabiliaceae bacterium]|nr:polysaccharide biosynthesis C-terminal domain-containing protein [Marinilabiliaceae bacterium]